MSELSPLPFADLVRRMRSEVDSREAIFDLPVKKWFTPENDLDFSATHFDRRAATPVGPAAGPHTQLAQNIVLSWLAGSRILELKTVQINDRLQIPRPCIFVPNVGYNVEWSQELRVEESVREYAKAVYLVEILKTTGAFGRLPATNGLETIYDISVGYDLEGIRSAKVTGFLRQLHSSRELFDELRRELHGDLRTFRDLELPESISDCVTLSTFHGCPADQIESISRYLIEELGLHTIVKLNPTLLGYDEVRELLIERLGYRHLELDRDAFDADLRYEDGLEILRRLRRVAESRGSTIGAKFTNTLVVKNRKDYFPSQADPYMYLSGQPLHVISMTLMQRFREDLGFEFPVSFSAGIDAVNFPAAVACGMVPITTCTDLLRQGGYGRLPLYLRGLAKAMKKVPVTSREAFVLAARGHGLEAIAEALRADPGGDALFERHRSELARLAEEQPDVLPEALRRRAAQADLDGDRLVLRATRVAGRMNGRDIVARLADEKRYHADNNKKTPRRIESELALYDCINCDLCITACPNDAIFAYEVEPVAKKTRLLGRHNGGVTVSPAAGRGFEIRESHQLAVLEGACNECSNCEVFCPEHGAPFEVKERLFLTREAFYREPHLEGFCHEGGTFWARLEGFEIRIDVEEDGRRAQISGEGFRCELDWEKIELIGNGAAKTDPGLDTALLWRAKVAWQSIFRGPTPNPVRPAPG